MNINTFFTKLYGTKVSSSSSSNLYAPRRFLSEMHRRRRKGNAAIGLGLVVVASTLYVLTMRNVGQDDFKDIDDNGNVIRK